ncbi:MAG: sugar ABC transporter substrate-binding protein [Betaproteobacteria bacterium]|nr:sugar ABC transporter substrate-binding protein [Betaproteobacteria bacterium]
MKAKIKRTLQITMLAAALISAAPAAFGAGEKLAVFTKNNTNPFFQAVRLGADSAAKQMKVGLTQFVPTKPDSIPEQMSQMEDVIVKKPDAIVLVPVDYKAMVPGVEKLNAAGIPLVNIVDRSAGGKFVSYVGADDYVLGMVTARYLIKAMKGKGNVVIMEGVRGSLTSADRVRGFNAAIKEAPGVKLVASQPANFQRLQALQVMENLMQSHPAIDGVLAANDAMALGALEALDGAKRKALAVGINATKEGVDAIKAGRMLASGDYNGFVQGCLGTMIAVRTLRKQPVPKEVLLPAVVVDKTNYGPYDLPVDQRSCPKWEEMVKG